jgi:hypothetical protein
VDRGGGEYLIARVGARSDARIRRRDISLREIIAFEQQCHAAGFRQCARGTIAEIQSYRVAALAETKQGAACKIISTKRSLSGSPREIPELGTFPLQHPPDQIHGRRRNFRQSVLTLQGSQSNNCDARVTGQFALNHT